MLCQLQRLFSFELCETMIMFSELERSGEEEVMACFEVISWHSPGGTEENHKSFRIVYIGQDLNWAPHKYKSEALLLELICSVLKQRWSNNIVEKQILKGKWMDVA
jgi:hypothetical protein